MTARRTTRAVVRIAMASLRWALVACITVLAIVGMGAVSAFIDKR